MLDRLEKSRPDLVGGWYGTQSRDPLPRLVLVGAIRRWIRSGTHGLTPRHLQRLLSGSVVDAAYWLSFSPFTFVLFVVNTAASL